MTTRVVHCKKEPYDIYIGRPSPWGNPFPIGWCVSREEAIERYRTWLLKEDWITTIDGPSWGYVNPLMNELHTLRGKTLGCWCSPKPCHGDILASLADG